MAVSDAQGLQRTDSKPSGSLDLATPTEAAADAAEKHRAYDRPGDRPRVQLAGISGTLACRWGGGTWSERHRPREVSVSKNKAE